MESVPIVITGSRYHLTMSRKSTRLHRALRDGCLRHIISSVKNGTDIEKMITDDEALLLAAENRHKDIVKYLINAGSNLNYCNREKWTLLHYTSQNGWVRLVQSLLEKGANIDAKNDCGHTPLLKAVYKGHKDMVEVLINAGANLNCYDDGKWTVLHYAACNGWLHIVQSLLEKGANIDAKNNCGHTPLLKAAYHGHEDIVKVLINAGANLNYCYNREKWTVLHYAVRNGWQDIVLALLNKKAYVNARTISNDSPLTLACDYKELEIVKHLIKAGVDVNVTSNGGDSPLSNLIKTSNINLVKLLIRSGAYFKSVDYQHLETSVYKRLILKNVNLSTQAIINEFNHKDLPELYKLSMSFTNLPCINQLRIGNDDQAVHQVIQSVEHEIKAKGHCDIKNARPIVLKMIAAKSFVCYCNNIKKWNASYKRKRSAEIDSDNRSKIVRPN